jgi:hypothetical protein
VCKINILAEGCKNGDLTLRRGAEVCGETVWKFENLDVGKDLRNDSYLNT